MRSLLAIALFIWVIFAPLGVCAEENVISVNETETVAIIENATNVETTSPDLALLFGKVHITLLMSTEEAFSYLLMNDTAEKQAFFDGVAVSEEAFTAFEDAAAKAGENESILVTGYEQVKEDYAHMTGAADAMFASFEKEGKPVQEDVIAFEESVDTVFNGTDNTWVAYNSGMDIPPTSNASIRALYGKLLGAVEESYAYPVLGDKTEKENALADFAEFDARVARYAEEYPATSYDDLKAVKDEIQTAAESMFATFEKDGKVNEEEVATLEKLVEKMNVDCLKLFDQASSEKAPVISETGNETVVNTTA
ncbi:MAG: hypothetical protein CVV33_01410 [Methanomicrobiales archaeon HGW-Methanomicrobiales-4]|nr:MAG: hypothetical protein CVV33_01410 [Methanomicrobiales archaeon HGW-Methanomicrobiales-4]